ncbi:MAG TPA: glycosyltransferase family 4 protein [Caldilineaceae bacterium]|nr:glycosyltransferase family 4 protein [Caldilineaceae bacterium]
MRILFTVHKYPPESLGGTEIYTLTLARALHAAGHRVTVFYPSSAVERVTITLGEDGVTLWQVPLPATRQREDPIRQFWHTFRDQAMEAAFVDCLRETQPDIVHFQHVQGVSARLIALAADYPRVATLHDYWYFCANSQLIRPDQQPCLGPSWGNWNCVDCATARADLQRLRVARPLVALPFAARNRYLRRLSAAIDHFIAPSHFLRQQYVAQGWPADKITVLENGMDRRRLRNAQCPTLPAPATRPHFGFLGSLAWQKGVHVLIEAFNQLPATASLTIYGSDQAFPAYGAQLRALATHPHIRFTGAVSYENVGAALRQLDALVVPSLWYENSPLVIQEAYVMGVPVLASKLGALPEKVRDGATGYLFPAGDSSALAALLQRCIDEPLLLTNLLPNIVPPPTVEEHTAEIGALYGTLGR